MSRTLLSRCRRLGHCGFIACVCDVDPTDPRDMAALRKEEDAFSTTAELKRLSTIRTQGNPYPLGSDLFEAFERCRRPAF